MAGFPQCNDGKLEEAEDLKYNFVVYEGCSNMNASSFITFFTYLLRQNVIPFWKELFVAFKMVPNITKHSLYFSSYIPLYMYKGHSCMLKFVFEANAMHVLVHVRI